MNTLNKVLVGVIMVFVANVVFSETQLQLSDALTLGNGESECPANYEFTVDNDDDGVPSQGDICKKTDFTVVNSQVGIGTSSPNAKLEVSGGNTILEQEAWQPIIFQNGWGDLSGFSSKYFKDSLGIVHLEGVVQAGDHDACIFYLPENYRPSQNGAYIVAGNNVQVRIDIHHFNGCVIRNTGFTNPTSLYYYLSGISFRASN